jgi:hypothetical protein
MDQSANDHLIIGKSVDNKMLACWIAVQSRGEIVSLAAYRRETEEIVESGEQRVTVDVDLTRADMRGRLFACLGTTTGRFLDLFPKFRGEFDEVAAQFVFFALSEEFA